MPCTAVVSRGALRRTALAAGRSRGAGTPRSPPAVGFAGAPVRRGRGCGWWLGSAEGHGGRKALCRRGAHVTTVPFGGPGLSRVWGWGQDPAPLQALRFGGGRRAEGGTWCQRRGGDRPSTGGHGASGVRVTAVALRVRAEGCSWGRVGAGWVWGPGPVAASSALCAARGGPRTAARG